MDDAVSVSYTVIGDRISFLVSAHRQAQAVGIGFGKRMVNMTAYLGFFDARGRGHVTSYKLLRASQWRPTHTCPDGRATPLLPSLTPFRAAQGRMLRG